MIERLKKEIPIERLVTGFGISRTDARNVATTLQYDAASRIRSKTYNEGTPAVTYCYDGDTAGDCIGAPGDAVTNLLKGRLTRVSTTASAMAYGQYDALGRVLKSTQSISGLSGALEFVYTWNDLALSSVTYPSGRKISYEYDAAARAVSITGQVGIQAATTYVAGVNYAEHGGVEQVQFGNARYERNCYNDRLQASAIVLRTAPPVSACADSTANLAVLGFGYGQASENNGNLRTQTVSDGAAWSANQSYEYDALNRLQSALESGTTGWKVTFGHDRWGNRWVDPDAAATYGYALDAKTPVTPDWFTAKNRLLLSPGSFDRAGNQLVFSPTR